MNTYRLISPTLRSNNGSLLLIFTLFWIISNITKIIDIFTLFLFLQIPLVPQQCVHQLTHFGLSRNADCELHAVQSNYVMLFNTPISTNVSMMKLYIVKITLKTIYQNTLIHNDFYNDFGISSKTPVLVWRRGHDLNYLKLYIDVYTWRQYTGRVMCL